MAPHLPLGQLSLPHFGTVEIEIGHRSEMWTSFDKHGKRGAHLGIAKIDVKICRKGDASQGNITSVPGLEVAHMGLFGTSCHNNEIEKY